jgi:hypothetical protein
MRSRVSGAQVVRRVLPAPTSLGAPAAAVPARGSVDVLTILRDQLGNVPAWFRRICPRICHCAAQAHIVAKIVDALGIGQEIIHVCLPNAKSSVDVPSIVSFLTIAHGHAS